MATGDSVAPVIIKRKKVSGGGGHHGGAWKVAYADFVTAMMAFFMLMWLLNATTEKQRKGIADYFNPTVPIIRISGGGEYAFDGQSIFTEATLSQMETGASGERPPWVAAETSANSQGAQQEEAQRLLEEVNATLVGGGGESVLKENELRHIISKITDEGVVIEIFDLPDSPLFDSSEAPTPTLRNILTEVSRIVSTVEKQLAIVAHTRSEPVVRADFDGWQVSTKRSLEVRQVLEFSGTSRKQMARLTGKSDTDLSTNDPLDVRNNRVEIIFLHEE